MLSKGRVLVVGSGGREHALALGLSRSASVADVRVAPGNAGTAPWNLEGDPFEIAVRDRPDLVVVGPEGPLCAGLVDRLAAAGIVAYGPTAAAARLEGSKAFMKEFCARHGIPTADFAIVKNERDLARAMGIRTLPPVVKADGLCGGKGVVVADTMDEAYEAARQMLAGEAFGDAGRVVVLEDRIHGAEASIHAISDGERVCVLPVAQDHKRIGDGDTGPNTGGMGAYGPAPLVGGVLLERVRREIIDPTVRGMAEDGVPCRGTLFFGLMITPAGDPILLEINVRFGDPETQVLTSLVDGDLAEALAAAAAGELSPDALRVRSEHALTVVLAARGYPQKPVLGDVIEGIELAQALPGVCVHHAGTKLDGGRVVTAGGRVLAVTARAPTLREAHARAYEAVDRIHFEGMQFRRDIGARAL